MHPDEAVDIALQDLHATLNSAVVVRSVAAARPDSPLRALWRRYIDGWTWYAASGLTPPAPEAAFPLARVRPRPVARRAAAPCIHHPLELLFGGTAAAGCR
jgi:hypothetical protein